VTSEEGSGEDRNDQIENRIRRDFVGFFFTGRGNQFFDRIKELWREVPTPEN
jgi:hypothetical protein